MATPPGREPMLKAITASRVISVLSLTVCLSLLLLNIAGIVDRFRLFGCHGLSRSRSRQSFGALFMFCLMATAAAALYVSSNYYYFVGMEAMCNNMIGAIVGLFVAAKQSLFLFLYFRAKIVHDALRLDGTKMRWLRRFILFTITLGIPASFGWTYFLVFFGKVIPEGPCILYTDTVSSIIAFAACDVGLSSILLILFVVPIWEHSKQLGIRKDKKLDVVIRKNLIVGALVICTTLIGLFGMVIFLNIAHGKVVAPEIEYLQVLAMLLPCAEMTFTVVMAHTLTKAWLPMKLWRMLRVKSQDTVTGNTTSGNKYVINSSSLALNGNPFSGSKRERGLSFMMIYSQGDAEEPDMLRQASNDQEQHHVVGEAREELDIRHEQEYSRVLPGDHPRGSPDEEKAEY